MATLFVFDEPNSRFVTADPAIMGRCKSCGGLIWTDSRFLYACKRLCTRYELSLCSSFRPLAGAAGICPARCAGLCGDFTLLSPCRGIAAVQNEIRRYCIAHQLFSYVYPQYSTPIRITGEVSLGRSSPNIGYPDLFPGNVGVHVFVLQQALNMLGFPCLMSGRLSGDTLSALSAFRLKSGLSSALVDAAHWRALFAAIKKGGTAVP